MKARAKVTGIYEGQRIRAGAVIEVKKGLSLPSWMEPAADAAPSVTKPVEPSTFSELNQELDRLEKRKLL